MRQSIITPIWPAPPNIVAGVTTRQGGCSSAPFDSFNLALHVGDDKNKVKRNRAALIHYLQKNNNVALSSVWLNQSHGTSCYRATSFDHMEKTVDADALTSQESNIGLFILTADCLPVLFSNHSGTVVGIAHAGWRGLCHGVIDECIRQLSVQPNTLYAWLGPAIGAKTFEVGQDVYDAYMSQCLNAKETKQTKLAFTLQNKSNASASTERKYLADIYQLCSIRLKRIGVSHIYGGGFCTASESRFYSYRRDKATGRMASFIFIRNTAETAKEYC